jgi:hypothetical protein
VVLPCSSFTDMTARLLKKTLAAYFFDDFLEILADFFGFFPAFNSL